MSMITCARIVIIDSEFDAKKGPGRNPRLSSQYMRT